jgi:hypothetical protein
MRVTREKMLAAGSRVQMNVTYMRERLSNSAYARARHDQPWI